MIDWRTILAGLAVSAVVGYLFRRKIALALAAEVEAAMREAVAAAQEQANTAAGIVSGGLLGN